MEQQPGRSPHILNASSNLLGICFIVLTSLKFFGRTEQTLLDEISFVAIILFMGSCVCSFMSMKAKKSNNLEKIADFIFMAGLLVLFVTAVLFSFRLIK